jgi:hypothetical protein
MFRVLGSRFRFRVWGLGLKPGARSAVDVRSEGRGDPRVPAPAPASHNGGGALKGDGRFPDAVHPMRTTCGLEGPDAIKDVPCEV